MQPKDKKLLEHNRELKRQMDEFDKPVADPFEDFANFFSKKAKEGTAWLKQKVYGDNDCAP